MVSNQRATSVINCKPGSTERTSTRPLVSFALLTYNHEKFIRDAVSAAFAQTYQPLEIIISDDCSTDQTFEIVQEMVLAYTGEHRVVLRRNPENLGADGLGLHVTRVFDSSEGELIV